jgi:hypothetical protein
VAWLGGILIGVGNGVAREVTVTRVMSEQRAHQLSCVSALGAFAAYFRALQFRWPLQGRNEALTIGGLWLALTTAFEFCFGRLVAKKSWSELTADYNLTRGRLWPVVLAGIAIGPEVARRRAEG